MRAAVVVPANFAIGAELIGDAQVATFAAFGSFALLLLVSFSGSRATRAGAHLALAVAGVALISIGTAAAKPDWLAVAATAVITFVVLFAGAVSSMVSAASQAALLTFVLAVMLPTGANLPHRLAGWGIAVAVCVPVALFVWPPREQQELRLRAASLCRAMAAMLDLHQPPPGGGDPLVAMRAAARDLQETFRSAASRTAGTSTAARTVFRLVDELQWLAHTVVNACADAPEQWPVQGRRLRAESAAMLRSCAGTLDRPQAGRRACAALDAQLERLADARRGVADEALAELRRHAAVPGEGPARGEFERPLYAAHELGYVVALTGQAVGLIAAADARSWWAKLAGRRVTADELGAVAVVRRTTLGHLDRRSVWLQNSVRGAAGLALAVLLARVTDAQNAFWIGLGALSVLRSTALSTGATAARALLGTVAGFVIGGALVAALGTNHNVLWALLPLVILLAAFAPAVISFAAGQAGFTVLVLILFNIIAPAGWQIGVVRVEDVALGSLASLGAGMLFWPRGAGSALSLALADAYSSAAAYLRDAVAHLTGARAEPARRAVSAMAAGQRLDDALRQYLAERGTKQVPLHSITTLANGAARVRLAATAIKRLHHDTEPDRDGLARPVRLLTDRTERVAGWYVALAGGFLDGRARFPAADGQPVDPQRSGAVDESFLDVVLPAVHGCCDAELAAQAERLLWSGQYLGDVDRLRPDLVEPAAQAGAARTRRWWHL